MKRLAIAALLATIASPAAFADTVKLDSFQFSDAGSMSFKLTRPGSTSITTSAGGFQGTLNGESFLSYCVDLLQSFSWGTASPYSTAVQGSGLPAWYTASKAQDIGRLYTGFSSLVTNAITSAAFQLAVWEIVTEAPGTAYDTDTGAFTGIAGHTTDPAKSKENLALDTADNWLQSLPGYSNYSIRIEYSSSKQDLVTAKHVPEPTGVALAATAFGLLALSRRRQGKAALPV